MLKIFLTGDNHIGLKYAGHERSALLVEARLSAFDRMVQTANDEECDLFVVAGDLFENTYSVAKRDIARIFNALSQFRGIVAILPGNHDCFDADVKVWQAVRDVTATMDNIVLLTEYRPYLLSVGEKEIVLYPALCNSLHSAVGQNSLGWIKDQDWCNDTAYHIGVAHGAVEGETIDSEGQYFRMTRRELDSIPVDAWLIGHTHVPFPSLSLTMSACSERIFNAGTHVQTDVACNTEGVCVVIEVADDKSLRAKKIVSGDLRFVRLHLLLSAGAMKQTIEEALAPFADRTVVDLVLSGAVSAEEYQNRTAILETALSRFTEGTYNDHALTRLISRELIEAEYPETSFSAGLLSALLDEPKEAQLMYELLQELKGEV